MYQSDAEMLFPPRVIPALRTLRGGEWQALVAQVNARPENDPDVLAFGLLMIRLTNCITCNADSYRALRGCTQCAQNTVIRFKGTDSELVALWQSARAEVMAYLDSRLNTLSES